MDHLGWERHVTSIDGIDFLLTNPEVKERFHLRHTIFRF